MDSPAWKVLLDDDSRPHPELPDEIGNKSVNPGEQRIGERK